jgi:anti-anti-sigma factor
MQHLKIFQLDQVGDTLVVTPHGEGSAFRYQDLHLEANTIRGLITRNQIRNLLIDLGQMSYFGSEFIGSLVSMLREMRTRRGQAAFCGASPDMAQVLESMGLFRLWTNYPTREEAIQAFQAPPPPAP